MDPNQRTLAILNILEDSSEAKRRRDIAVEEQALSSDENLSKGRRLALVYHDKYSQMTEDSVHEYCKKLTHMFSWEILETSLAK